MSKCVPSVFASSSFMIYSLTFSSLMNFEFIFVYCVRECSNFILHLAVMFLKHHLLKMLSFPHCIFSFFFLGFID